MNYNDDCFDSAGKLEFTQPHSSRDYVTRGEMQQMVQQIVNHYESRI